MRHAPRKMLVTIVLLALAILTGIATAAPLLQNSDVLTTLSSRSNLRGGPGTDWTILGTYDGGTPIRLDGRAPGGGWVRGIVPDGKVGWVLDTAVAIGPEAAAGLRSVWVDEPFTLPAPEGGAPPSAPPAEAEAAAGPPAEAPAQPVAAGAGLNTTITNNVRVRSTPNGQVIGNAFFNQAIVIDGRNAEQDWVRATLPDGIRGWIAVSFVAITGEQLAALPVVEGGAITQAAAPAASAEAGSAPVEAAAVVNTAPVRGFNLGGHVSGLGANTVNAMRQAGMSWVKKQFRYSQGQGADSAAGLINDAHANGFRIILGIVGKPEELNNANYYADYSGFLAGVAALGADAIEVWNEPNIDREWPGGSISPASFTELLAQAYRAIKGANSNTMVISGAPAPTGFFGGCSGAGCDDNLFIAGMANAGAANYMDCLGIHYNEGIVPPNQTSGDPRGNSGHYSRYFWGMINTYWSAFRGARPLCFTELGYLTPEGYPPLPGGFAWAQNVTLAQQASWLDQAVSLAANSGKVRLLIVWNVDFTFYGDDPMGGYAMIRPDGSCPACEALAR